MNKLHLIVRNQFPEFVREDYPVFVAFVEAYYKWVDENSVGTLEEIKSLDKTPEEFVQYFRTQLDAHGIFNQTTPFDKIYLQKIKQIYNAKGSEKALVNVLRLAKQADTIIKYPNEYILRASDGKWSQDSFITVECINGSLPETITEFYVNHQQVNIAVPVKKFIVVDPARVRLYYATKNAVSLTLNQFIIINDINGVFAYSGKVVRSPSRLTAINGGQNWQVGQVIIVPGDTVNTVARVTEVDSNGAIIRVEILEYGYDHIENQLITVSPYPNKPLGSTYNITSELISVDPIAYHHTLDVFDYTEGADERIVGSISGLAHESYFLEDYAEQFYTGDTVLDISSISIQQQPGAESDITMEQWLASRATFRYEFDPVINLKGRWKDESGLISNQSIRLEDNYYYQQFSYDIQTTSSSAGYIDIAQDIHPAGMKMFTTYSMVEEIQITPIGDTTFPYIRLDLNDVSTIADSRVKRIVKPREDVAEPLDIISSKRVDKYLIDSATASSEDTATFSTTTYDDDVYFSEGYVRTENTLDIGV